MAETIEVNTEEYSCKRVDDLAVITLGEKAFQIATRLDSKERFTQLLSTIEKSPSIKGVAVLNTSEYPGDESYREFLGSIMRGDTQTAHTSGVLASRYGNAVSQLALCLSEFSKPIVAGLSGSITGEQLGMVLPCDFRIATQDVTFSFPNVAMGFPPTGVLVFYLLQIVGPARTSEILFSTNSLEADDALKMGLLTRLVGEGEFEKQCLDQLKRLTELPAEAVAATRRLIQPDPLELHRFLDHSRETLWSALAAMKVVS